VRGSLGLQELLDEAESMVPLVSAILWMIHSGRLPITS
jgi:hypothetical protein